MDTHGGPLALLLWICLPGLQSGTQPCSTVIAGEVRGRDTNASSMRRLALEVLDELKRIHPTLPSGQRRVRHHQWYTPDLGRPKLKEHLAGVMALMRGASPNWGRPRSR